jgi:hypothetical protein
MLSSPKLCTKPTASLSRFLAAMATKYTLRFVCSYDTVIERLFRYLSRQDICCLRLASSAYRDLVTARLFADLVLTFRLGSLAHPSRIPALSRIGHHVIRLTVTFLHSEDTLLPRLVYAESGEEVQFRYTPRGLTPAFVVQSPILCTQPELERVLKLNFPPLFHQSIDIRPFWCLFAKLPNLHRLAIRILGQARDHSRKDSVDYALISLRMALEHSSLINLTELSLYGQPRSFLYLRPVPGYGSSPRSGRCWWRIRQLSVTVSGAHGACSAAASSLVADVVCGFVVRGNLEMLSLSWHGTYRGPCLAAMVLASETTARKLPRLALRNTALNLNQLAALRRRAKQILLIDVRFSAQGICPVSAPSSSQSQVSINSQRQ